LGVGGISKNIVLTPGSAIKIPSGATGCSILNVTGLGFINVEETTNNGANVGIRNCAIVDIDIASGKTAYIYDSAIQDSEATLEAEFGGTIDDTAKADCMFSFDNLAGEFIDYNLKANSRLINAGEPIAGLTTDGRGKARNACGKPDIGARESQQYIIRLPNGQTQIKHLP